MGVLLSQFPGECSRLQLPPAPPKIQVPFLGELQQARKSLYALPDGSEMWMRFMDSLALAMAPARQFIELLELGTLYKDCMGSIIDAVAQISPDPIFACLKKVMKKLATLASYFPPLSYVKLIIDCLSAGVQLLDEVVYMIVWLDGQITSWRALVQQAQTLGDKTLLSIADCEISEYGLCMLNAKDIMMLISPGIRVLLEPITQNIPSYPLKLALTRLVDIEKVLTDLDTTVREAVTDAGSENGIDALLESLGQVLTVLCSLETVLVDIYNVAGPMLGLDPLQQRARPGTVNF